MADAAATHRAIDALWRLESPRIVAAVARLTRDVPLAEELAQDALVAALEHWPAEGVPANPAAWLTATAKNRALDRLRQLQMADRKHQEIGADLEARQAHRVPDALAELVLREEQGGIADDLLRLVFTACHPVLSRDAQVALTLKLLGGLTTPEIARAFLVPEPTIAQRIVRAKRSLTAARVPFEVPTGDQLAPRLAAVLEVIYLIFNEGYVATTGADWTRPALCDEALRLAHMLGELAPALSEAAGLAALLEIQASRLAARVDAHGRPVLLLDQDRTCWDRQLIGRGLAALARAEALAQQQGTPLGPYALQASIAACHARAERAEDTDWARICALYDALQAVQPSPVVALNRAVAVGMAYGPAAALPLVEALADDPQLASYHLLPSVQADLLARLDRPAEARAQLERALALATNGRERELLQQRLHALPDR
ncbi:MAG: RNA polymerase sigma factor [Rubrivivax sp.]|nr:RNA polymerase sigma factor [Rubrivivax sp.]